MGGVEEDAASRAEAARVLQEAGAPPEVVAKARGRQVEAVFEVWPENWTAFQVFRAMRTQWMWLTVGATLFRTGLRYEALDFTLRALGIEQSEHEKVFDQVRTMEDAALTAWSEVKS